MFDFHIHLTRLPHPKQLTQLLCDQNYDFIAVACETWEWKEIAKLKKEFSTEVKPFKSAYGIHPMIATQVTNETVLKLRKFLENDELAMVGEAGIDKRYPGYDDGLQDRIFLEQAKLALELKRDLQIHCVGDYQRILRLLTEAGFTQDHEIHQQKAASLDLPHQAAQLLNHAKQEMPRPCFHRFGGDSGFVKKALPFGALFSLHTDSFHKKSTAAAIPHIPQERIFFETDADETFILNADNATAKANKVIRPLAEGMETVTSTATVDPGTESGVTSERAAGVTTPEEILAELERRLESVRAAYAKCRE